MVYDLLFLGIVGDWLNWCLFVGWESHILLLVFTVDGALLVCDAWGSVGSLLVGGV